MIVQRFLQLPHHLVNRANAIERARLAAPVTARPAELKSLIQIFKRLVWLPQIHIHRAEIMENIRLHSPILSLAREW